ncbi:MAG: universal stress protein [Gemmatimonadetes bacterium]|nr:universal stress protein [Gemmatimonadota bacterium]
MLIAVDAAPFAERVSSWLPDLVPAGVRRATLLHIIQRAGEACADELDELRPSLDRLAVHLSAHAVEAEVALKRGDRARWILTLAELRAAQLIVMGPHCSISDDAGPIGSTLRLVLEESPVPLLLIGVAKVSDGPRLFERPFLFSAHQPDPVLEGLARWLIPASILPTRLEAGECWLPGQSLVVTGTDPGNCILEDVLREAWCPALVFPARSLRQSAFSSLSTSAP